MAEWLSFSLDPEQETAPGDVKGYAEASKKIRHPYEGKNDLQQDTGSKLDQSLCTTLAIGLQEKARGCQPEVTFISPHGGSSK